jgi:hypothetical protein
MCRVSFDLNDRTKSGFDKSHNVPQTGNLKFVDFFPIREGSRTEKETTIF